MPELPEVESVRRVLAPEIVGRRLTRVRLRRQDLRWPLPARELAATEGHVLEALERVGKYLLFRFAPPAPYGWIAHLGMSGKLLLDAARSPHWRAHEHYRLEFDGVLVRYVDPRRFGALLVAETGREREHPRLAVLGPDPFDGRANAAYLVERAKGRRTALKSFLLDGSQLAGIGNIYANEALFQARLDPRRAAGTLSAAEWRRLLGAVRAVMRRALSAGGTTLRDHVDAHGEPGWFQLQLAVYGRGGAPCPACAVPLTEIRAGGRSTVFCAHCQSPVSHEFGSDRES